MENEFHDVKGVDSAVVGFGLLGEVQQEGQRCVEEHGFFSALLGALLFVPASVGLDNAGLGSQDSNDRGRDAGGPSQNGGVRFLGDSLQSGVKHLLGQVSELGHDEQATDENFESVGSDFNSATVLELKQHLEEVVAKTFNTFFLQEGVSVLSGLGQLGPLKEILERLTVFFNSEPDTNEDQVLIVLKLLFS